MGNDEIVLELYNPDWSVKAQEEIASIKTKCKFSWIKNIEHFGSTAIKNIMAKPIFDILIGVENIEQARELIPMLEIMNYTFWQENPKKDRLFFVKGMPPHGKKRIHHVHVVETLHYEYFARILFRDYLSEHKDIAAQYENLKKSLATKYSKDREGYTEAKTDFIREVMQKAIIPRIAFEQLQDKHLPLIHKWLNNSHLAKWWGDDYPNLQQVKDKYTSYIQSYKIEDNIQKPIHSYVIKIEDQLVGYIQYYNAYDFAKDKYDLNEIKDLPINLASVDFYLGEESYLGNGLGSVILNKFLPKFVEPYYKNCLVDPNIKNKSAICSYENSGFEQFKTIEDLDILIMLKKL